MSDMLEDIAEKGDPKMQQMVGSMYSAGAGVKQDHVKAVKWFRKAAETGFAEAQRSLGYKYLLGEGVARNENEGMKWMKRAADQGDKLAIECLERSKK